MDKISYVGNADVNAIDYLYEQYRQNPENVDSSWSKFFEGFEFAQTNLEEKGVIPENYVKEFKVLNLINGYRTRGHLFTKTNPVRERRQYAPTLEISNFGLSEADLNVVFQAGEEIGMEKHRDADQFIRIEQGEAIVQIGKTKSESYVLHTNYSILIPAGTWHNVINSNSKYPLKLYTVYTPPQHKDKLVQKMKSKMD